MGDTKRCAEAPIDAQYRAATNQLASAIDAPGAPCEVSFVLPYRTFPFDAVHRARCNFMSNAANHKDLILLFKEMIARFEGHAEMNGTA